jgi:hypothetical protein
VEGGRWKVEGGGLTVVEGGRWKVEGRRWTVEASPAERRSDGVEGFFTVMRTQVRGESRITLRHSS